MKKRIFLLACLFNFQIFGQETIPQSLLNNVANEIDNICGDTWCEGDFNWSFNNLTCELSEGACSMSLTLIDQFYLDDGEDADRQITDRKIYLNYLQKLLTNSYTEQDEDGLQFHYPKTCKMNGFNTIKDVVDGNSYSEKIFEAVSECLSDIENKFYQVQSEASLRKSLHFCSAINVKKVTKEKDPNRQRVNNQSFYNEYQTWLDLLSFTKRLSPLENPRKSKLIYLTKWDNPERKRCLSDIAELYSSYFILGLNPITPIWSPDSSKLRTFIFTKQNYNSRLKVQLYTK
jgi:hypothetical protein